MSKRMADTEIWNKDWFLDLTIKQKLLVKYVFDNCDCAGIYEISHRNLRVCFGTKIQKEDFEKIKQFIFLENGKIFIEDFIQFQYGISINELNPKNNVHKGILKSLNKNGVLPTLSQPLANPYPRVLDKDMVKDKDKDNTLSKQVDTCNTENENFKKIDIFCDERVEKIFTLYSENCKNLCKLTFERKNKEVRELIGEFLQETSYDFESFVSLCNKADSLKVIATNKIDLKSMLKNHIGIMNGKYDNSGTAKKGLTKNDIDRIFED